MGADIGIERHAVWARWCSIDPAGVHELTGFCPKRSLRIRQLSRTAKDAHLLHRHIPAHRVAASGNIAAADDLND
jgi:hypothetical protein